MAHNLPQYDKLLSRNEFRAYTFARDDYTCVFCNRQAVDAHHIIERRLWNDYGYYISNGASVCANHHIACEMTTISVEQVREACGIEKFVIPEHLYADQSYDKWANIVLPNGQRLKGELFFDDSVQKILKRGGVLGLFTGYVKYPRTFHLPWSAGMNDDDKMMPSINAFEGQRVIVTEKLDGENTTMYSDHIHARAVDSANHESRNWVKNFWSNFSFEIPKDWRVCGENMYAEHSIQYKELESYFYGFSIWDDRNECLSWDETIDWFAMLHPDIQTVPLLYDGIFDEDLITSLWNDKMHDTHEGYVIRLADRFPMSEFRTSVGKFVRKNHVNTVKHWMHGRRMVVNSLKGDK